MLISWCRNPECLVELPEGWLCPACEAALTSRQKTALMPDAPAVILLHPNPRLRYPTSVTTGRYSDYRLPFRRWRRSKARREEWSLPPPEPEKPLAHFS